MSIPEILRALLDDTDKLRAKVLVTHDNANEGIDSYMRNLTSVPDEHMAAIDALADLAQALEAAADALGKVVAEMEGEISKADSKAYDDTVSSAWAERYR